MHRGDNRNDNFLAIFENLTEERDEADSKAGSQEQASLIDSARSQYPAKTLYKAMSCNSSDRFFVMSCNGLCIFGLLCQRKALLL